MKIRFWQKTYILALLLFLLCLYAGLFSLAFYTYGKSVKNAESVCVSERSYIARSFERDCRLVSDDTKISGRSLLMESYVSHYKKEGVLLAFIQGGETVCSSFVSLPELIGDGTVFEQRIDGARHIVIASPVYENTFTLVYAKDASALDGEFKTLMITYAFVAAAASAILAVSLLFVLKKLSVPLDKLRAATEKITSGDMTVTADETGKDEFADLAKSFNTMVGTINRQISQLEKDAEQKQMLVDNMAHEMRTPLTSIRGYAEYIERAAVPDEEKNDAARRIISETDRLKKISEIILDSALIRGGTIEKDRVDLGALLKDTAERLKSKAEKLGVAIICDVHGSTVYGNASLLSMLFYNLTENALKACDPGGEVRLLCDGDTVKVKDSGKGMTKEQLTHITEPFYRTDKSRSRADGGAGLGLALCSNIVKAHGAEMRFESEQGKGTEVTVTFSVELNECGEWS